MVCRRNLLHMTWYILVTTCLPAVINAFPYSSCRTVTSGSCTLCPRVYSLLHLEHSIPNVSQGWRHQITQFKEEYISSRSVDLAHINYVGCTIRGLRANPPTIINKLSLLFNELQNMIWWSRQIQVDVAGTLLAGEAGELLNRHIDTMAVLNQELIDMRSISSCHALPNALWDDNDTCMDYQVNLPSNSTHVQLIHAMMRMEELLMRFNHVQPIN